MRTSGFTTDAETADTKPTEDIPSRKKVETMSRRWTITKEKHPDLVYQEKDGAVLVLQLKRKPGPGIAKLIALHLNAWHARPRQPR